jgi:hypothetical protein
MIYQVNGIQKQVEVSLLISDKADFKSQSVRRDKEGHYILVKRTIHQKDKMIVNIYELNDGTLNFIKQTLYDIKGQKDPNTKIVCGFNTLLSPIYRSSRQKIKQFQSQNTLQIK